MYFDQSSHVQKRKELKRSCGNDENLTNFLARQKLTEYFENSSNGKCHQNRCISQFSLIPLTVQCKSKANFLSAASRLDKGKERVECWVAQRAYVLTVQFQTNFF